ncbi:class I SAM-dependent methyltransferase [Paenibacillus crassostreae]|uniref:Methyltransferase domain-containing protein n=1 Tax=Paenibacillus crassostreae TaxID=1763538 RepID=A0A167DWE6_9BACL|nr:class I SAM-dependent methyltransferase [Paenibacillus crassostreae]AOZ90979.1 hypothetical protein LPB68_01355 [Paenibacillus crassostreae]OAB74858.1 hypothetical protein PNBC_12600 [Paenibacillus crassostreae]
MLEQADFAKARKAEANYHNELYHEHEILEAGSWMSKPNSLVMEMLDRLLEHKERVNVLDLGCGAGRNTIPMAMRLKGTGSQMLGTDLLAEAIDKLHENALEYGVTDGIQAEEVDVELTNIAENHYDFIVACGCLEHVSSEIALVKVLNRMKLGTKLGGIHCITMNTDVQEVDIVSGREREPLIELNLPMERATTILQEVYAEWNILEHKTVIRSIAEDKYDTPTQFRCHCITLAVQKIK